MGTGERFAVDTWQGQTQQGTVAVETTQFPHGDHVAVLMFVSPRVDRNASPLGAVLQQINVRPSQARSVAPPRMRIGTVRRGESWRDLARRATGDAGHAETIANMNGFDVGTAPTAGLTVKLPEEVVPEM